jgi:hypothetical protein
MFLDGRDILCDASAPMSCRHGHTSRYIKYRKEEIGMSRDVGTNTWENLERLMP